MFELFCFAGAGHRSSPGPGVWGRKTEPSATHKSNGFGSNYVVHYINGKDNVEVYSNKASTYSTVESINKENTFSDRISTTHHVQIRCVAKEIRLRS